MSPDSLDNIIVLAQLLQQADLADRRARYPFILRFQSDLLQGHEIAC